MQAQRRSEAGSASATVRMGISIVKAPIRRLRLERRVHCGQCSVSVPLRRSPAPHKKMKQCIINDVLLTICRQQYINYPRVHIVAENRSTASRSELAAGRYSPLKSRNPILNRISCGRYHWYSVTPPPPPRYWLEEIGYKNKAPLIRSFVNASAGDPFPPSKVAV